jgi:hypothetical protein
MLSQSTRYYVPQPSTYPIFGSFALLLMALGAASWFNGVGWGKYVTFAGMAVLFYMIAGWFSTVAHESESGEYNKQVDASFRWGMGWFIFSEVMFFGAFFGALFYMRVLSVPDLGGLESQQLIWPGFKPAWPTAGPGIAESFTPMGAWGLPALNTLILGRDGHVGALGPAQEQSLAAHLGPRAHRAARRAVHHVPGDRVFPRLQRAQPEAHDRRLRLDVLPAHRFPRLPRDDRHDHADRHPLSQRRGAFQARAPLRLRRGGVVLALRRRGLARAFHLRLLAIKRQTKKNKQKEQRRQKNKCTVSREAAPH